jgi:hypothetical protein
MPEITAALHPTTDHASTDLVIDTFDQWHNSPEALVAPSLQTFTGAFPGDVVDPV